jgi:hypothetical protein
MAGQEGSELSLLQPLKLVSEGDKCLLTSNHSPAVPVDISQGGYLFRELRRGSHSITVTHDDAKPPLVFCAALDCTRFRATPVVTCISFARRTITHARNRHERESNESSMTLNMEASYGPSPGSGVR